MTSEKRIRRTAEASKISILENALDLAEELGLGNFTSKDLSERCNCRHTNIFYHFGNMAYLRQEMMKLAIERRNLPVLAQGLVSKDQIARSAPDALQKQALKSLTN